MKYRDMNDHMISPVTVVLPITPLVLCRGHTIIPCAGDADGDGVRETIADILSVTCGCTTTPSPELGTTLAPVPVTAWTLAPLTSGGTCSEGDSFSVSSGDLPNTEGCYVNTAFTYNEQIIYSTSGTEDAGQIWMVALEFAGDDDSDLVVSGRVKVGIALGVGHVRWKSQMLAKDCQGYFGGTSRS